jgi:hypothetical protein
LKALRIPGIYFDKRRKAFFSEEKKQKTFIFCGAPNYDLTTAGRPTESGYSIKRAAAG